METAADRGEALDVTVGGTLNLLEAVREAGSRVVHLGSWTEYGKAADVLHEALWPEPVCFHGTAKASATMFCQLFARTYGLQTVVLRLFSVYGPGAPAGRLIPQLLDAALQNREVGLTRPGIRHDFVAVQDVIDVCLLAAEGDVPAGEIINIGSGIERTNEEVVHVVEQVTGRTIRVRTGACPPRVWDSEHARADIRKAQRLLGWTPRRTLEQGIAETLEWLRNSPAARAA
jgi:nucleoside-diphosphate-sugar epimerase